MHSLHLGSRGNRERQANSTESTDYLAGVRGRGLKNAHLLVLRQRGIQLQHHRPPHPGPFCARQAAKCPYCVSMTHLFCEFGSQEASKGCFETFAAAVRCWVVTSYNSFQVLWHTGGGEYRSERRRDTASISSCPGRNTSTSPGASSACTCTPGRHALYNAATGLCVECLHLRSGPPAQPPPRQHRCSSPLG